MWKYFIMVGSVVVAAWAVDSRYALAEQVSGLQTALSAKISENTTDIRSGQAAQAQTSAEIEAKLNFFLDAREDALEIRKIELEGLERNSLQELEYQKLVKTLKKLETVK